MAEKYDDEINEEIPFFIWFFDIINSDYESDFENEESPAKL